MLPVFPRLRLPDQNLYGEFFVLFAFLTLEFFFASGEQVIAGDGLVDKPASEFEIGLIKGLSLDHVQLDLVWLFSGFHVLAVKLLEEVVFDYMGLDRHEA